MKQFLSSDIVDAAQKTSIGVTGVTYTFMGLPLSDVAALLTAVYMAAQIVILLLPKLKGLWSKWRNK